MTSADRSRHDTPTPRSVNGFIRWLASTEPPPNCANPYLRNGSRGNATRRHNLGLYLSKMAELRPRLMLVGEAPGYRGLRSTGIPFTSTKLLATHPFYRALDLRPLPDEKLRGEASATILQGVLDKFGVRPVLWNAYPFHPHRPSQPLTNRKPTMAELQIGARYLRWLIGHFAIEDVVAVGNSAETTLNKLNIPNTKVRHPAQSGATQFREQMTAFLEARCAS